jgi:hypothetical protein
MKANGVTTILVGIAAAIGFGIWFAVEHQGRLQSASEHRELEQQLAQMADLSAEHERLSNLVAQASHPQALSDEQSLELLRLRGEAGVLRRQSKELEAARNENRQARAALEGGVNAQGNGAARAAATADYWPRDSWAFKGYTSPDAALQSSLWAANNGDLKAVLASATGNLRQTMEKEFAGKSETEASIRAMDEVASLKSVRVLSREAQGDDTLVLTAAFEDRTDTHTSKLVLKKVGNEWKLSEVVR